MMTAPHEIQWSEERCGVCVEILRSASSYREGLEEIVRYFKRPVSGAALRNAFARHDLEPPAAYVGKPSEATPRRSTIPSPPPSVDLDDLDYDEDEGNAPTIANGDAPVSAVGGVPVSGPPVVVVRDEASGAPLSAALPAACRAYVDRGSDEQTYEFSPLDLGSQTTERVLIIPDTHAPYHDKRAWAEMTRFARSFRPDTVVHLGDWIDCFTISDHDRDPRRGTQLEDEIRATKELREEVDALGAQRKLFAAGNHSYRLERFCMRHAPARISMLRIENLLGLPENGWSVVPYMSHGRLGRLHFTHEAGHCGVHAVHQTGVAFASSVVFGHTHRLSSNYFGDVTGKRHVSASMGWLGSFKEARYISDVKKRYWQHGFGTAIIERSGDFRLDLVPIVDGRVVGVAA